MAYDLCLYVGTPHPDYLLGRDTLDNFKARGLTPLQWHGWIVYARHIPLPADRADIAVAFSRADQITLHGGKKIDAAKLVPGYGKARKKTTVAEMRAHIEQTLAAQAQRQAQKGKPKDMDQRPKSSAKRRNVQRPANRK